MKMFEGMNRLQYWINVLLLTVAFCIPFAKKYVPGFLVLLGIACIIKSIIDRKLYFYRKDIPLHLLAVLFGLHLWGVTYSENVDYAWTEIGIKLCLDRDRYQAFFFCLSCFGFGNAAYFFKDEDQY